MGGGQSKNQEIKKAYIVGTLDKKELPKIKPSQKSKPTLVINYSSMPNCAHYGQFIKDSVEAEFPEYFEYKVDIDFSSMPKLIKSE